MESLSQEQTKEFANKAKESWDNDVSKWSVAQIIEAGNLISKLPNYVFEKPCDGPRECCFEAD